MLPVEKATGQIWLADQYLCETEYDISAPYATDNEHRIQRVQLVVPDEHCVPLLDAYDLSLVVQDGHRYHIPRPFLQRHAKHLECYVETE